MIRRLAKIGKSRAETFLQKRGYCESSIADHCRALEENGGFVERIIQFVFRARISLRQSTAGGPLNRGSCLDEVNPRADSLLHIEAILDRGAPRGNPGDFAGGKRAQFDRFWRDEIQPVNLVLRAKWSTTAVLVIETTQTGKISGAGWFSPARLSKNALHDTGRVQAKAVDSQPVSQCALGRPRVCPSRRTIGWCTGAVGRRFSGVANPAVLRRTSGLRARGGHVRPLEGISS